MNLLNGDSKSFNCNLFYHPTSNIIDHIASKTGTEQYKKVYRADAPVKEVFLDANYVININDTIYLTNPSKNVTIFDLNSLKIIGHRLFDDIYDKIKYHSRKLPVIHFHKPSHTYINNFISLSDGKKISDKISEIENLKFVPIHDKDFHKYTLSRIELTGYLDHNGKFEIEKSKFDDNFNKEEILKYLNETRFKADSLPRVIEKQYFKYFFGGYRNYNDSIAENVTKLHKQKRLREFEERQLLDTIDGRYIPKNLKECFIELDKLLKESDRDGIKKYKSSMDMISFHLSLGMWLRNNWGLWGGSRLWKYFDQRDVGHPDSMSSIILDNYYLWLKGDEKVGEKWEKKNKIKKRRKRNN